MHLDRDPSDSQRHAGWSARAKRRHASYVLPVGETAPLDRLVLAHSPDPARATGVRLIMAGVDAFAWRAITARLAQRSLDLQYYIWHDDRTGRLLAHEALQAAERGVRVRILLDDMDARSRYSMLAGLDRHDNVEIRVFNPFVTRSGTLRTLIEIFARRSRLNHRMHNKAWLADGRIAILGGRNIGDEYFAASDAVNFIDADVLLLGGEVQAIGDSFDRYWNHAVSVPMAFMRRTARMQHSLQEVRAALLAHAGSMQDSDYVRELREEAVGHGLDDLARAVIWTQAVRAVVDDPDRALHRVPVAPGVVESVSAALQQATREVLITSPYFVPAIWGVAELRRLVTRGVDVAVLTNSLAATDVAAVHSGYARYRAALLEGGVRLFELKPAPALGEHDLFLRLGSSRGSLHTKAIVVDRDRLFVGSFNLDPRSARLNCEMGVWIEDRVLAQRLTEVFFESTRPERSYHVQLGEDGRTCWLEVAATGEVVHGNDPQTGWGRRFVTWLLQLLPIEAHL